MINPMNDPRIDWFVERLPDTVNVVWLNGGANFYLPDCVITAYWKNKKYTGNKTGNWHRFKDLDDLLSIIKKHLPQKPQKKHKESVGVTIQQSSTNGAQQCIDHITNKIKIVEKNNPNNAVLTVLRVLEKELKQYL